MGDNGNMVLLPSVNYKRLKLYGLQRHRRVYTDEWRDEEPQEVIFLYGIWRHIKEFGIEGQIPRISSPVKLEKRC